jgi:hypothetical protein
VGRPWRDDIELTGARPSAAPVLKGSGQGGDGVRELVPSLTRGWVAARQPSDEMVWWWSGVLGGGALQCGRGELVRVGFFGGRRGGFYGAGGGVPGL